MSQKIYFERVEGVKPSALVFLHANSSSGKVYDAFFDAGSPYSLIRIDLPGHGQSPHADDAREYRWPHFKTNVADFINATLDQPFLLIANSLGGHMGIELLGKLPHCRGLVIFGTPPLDKPLNAEQAFLATEASEFIMNETVSEGTLDRCISLIAKDPAIAQRLKADYHASDPKFRSEFVDSFLVQQEYDNEKQMVEQSEVPVYIIHGRNDPSVNLEYLQSLNNIKQLYILEDCGHYPSIEQPEEFARVMYEISDQVFGKEH